MGEINKDGDGPYFFHMGYHMTLCMGYGDYKGGS